MGQTAQKGNQFIEQCIKTGELQLTDNEKRSHFGIVIYPLIASAIFLFFGIYEILSNGLIWDISSNGIGLILGAIILFLLGFYIYRMQKNVLQFVSFDSDILINQKRRIIESVGDKLNWDITLEKENLVVGKIDNLSNWGEIVTIIFDKDYVMINSISDLSKKPNLFAPNHKHINAFIDEFEKTENQN